MCATDLDLTEPEQADRPAATYRGVAWGRLAEYRDSQRNRDGQDDLDGQDVPKPEGARPR
jgi:hypothetical protein